MTDQTGIIRESEVVSVVCGWLESKGWIIKERRMPTERGDDIVATRRGEQFRIEAKGEGSERPNSARFGKKFNASQVRTHVAVAFFRAAQMRAEGVRTGMALPDTTCHRDVVAKIEDAIRRLEIVVLWVRRDMSVRISTAG